MIILYIIIWIVIGLLASLYPLTIEYKRHGRTIYNEDIPFLIVFPIFGPVAVLMIAAVSMAQWYDENEGMRAWRDKESPIGILIRKIVDRKKKEETS